MMLSRFAIWFCCSNSSFREMRTVMRLWKRSLTPKGQNGISAPRVIGRCLNLPVSSLAEISNNSIPFDNPHAGISSSQSVCSSSPGELSESAAFSNQLLRCPDETGVPPSESIELQSPILILVSKAGPALLVLGRTAAWVAGILCLLEVEFWKSDR